MVQRKKSLTLEEQAQLALKKQVLPKPARLLPWLFGAFMLAVYCLTLNHWVSPDSIQQVVGLQGLTWLPELSGPVTYLMLLPFGVFPAEWIPMATNLFTAVCAALTLALLARSVALLPHDLSRHEQPWWIITPPSLMTARCPWLPQLVAVLVCGFQLTFWQNAITATSQMFNLLMFAFVILCLLEFNLSRADAWLLRGAFVYGLAMANDWAMAAFLPPLLIALLWVKRLYFFNEFFITRLVVYPDSLKLRLLWQIPACWLAGLSLFLLPPAIFSLSPAAPASYWVVLKYMARYYHASLVNFPKEILLICCLVSVTPFFLVSTRFYQFLSGFNRLNFYVPPSADNPHVHYLTGYNRMPVFLGTLFFQLVYGFFLLVGLWTMFDSPISPRRLNLGVACLPLYYLGALSIGFFTGHFLLTSDLKTSPPPPPLPEDASPLEWRTHQSARVARLLKYLTVLFLVLMAAGYPAVLFWKNLPDITIKRADPCGDYIGQLERELPPDGGVIIGSDSFRLLYLQSAVIRSGRQLDYMFLDTSAFADDPGYVDFIRQNYPGFNLASILPATGNALPSVDELPDLLKHLAAHYETYSLPPVPAMERYTEFFYLQPHGLFYKLKRYTPHHPYADPPPAEIVSNNIVFWQTFEKRQLLDLVAKINPPTPPHNGGLVQGFLNTLYFWPEADPESLKAGAYYANVLNDWGVELQKEGRLSAAGKYFAEALLLNPQNAAARINQNYYADLRAHRPYNWLTPAETAANLGVYRDWRHVAQDGLVDDPNFCNMLGSYMSEANLFRPALAQYQRMKELAPDHFDTYVGMAGVFLKSHDLTNLISNADEMLRLSPTNYMGTLLKAKAFFELKDFHQAINLLDQLVSLDASNSVFLLNRAIAYQAEGNRDAARSDFERVTQIRPGTFEAYFNLAKMAEEKTNHVAAITNYELFLRYAPTNSPDIVKVRAHLKALASPK